MERRPKCPYCKSQGTTKHGYRRTKTMGNRPRFDCTDCGRSFTQAVARVKRKAKAKRRAA